MSLHTPFVPRVCVCPAPVLCSKPTYNGTTACQSACVKACLRTETYQSALLDVLEVHAEHLSPAAAMMMNAR
jgi:hypothetical protein